MKKTIKIIVCAVAALCFLQSAFATETINPNFVLEDLEKNRSTIKSKLIDAKFKRNSVKVSCLQEKLFQIEKIINNFNNLPINLSKNKSIILLNESNLCSYDEAQRGSVDSSKAKMTIDYILPEENDMVFANNAIIFAIPVCASCIK